jgi:hypothetical protein
LFSRRRFLGAPQGEDQEFVENTFLNRARKTHGIWNVCQGGDFENALQQRVSEKALPGHSLGVDLEFVEKPFTGEKVTTCFFGNVCKGGAFESALKPWAFGMCVRAALSRMS